MSSPNTAKAARAARRAAWQARSCLSKTAYPTAEAAFQKNQTVYRCRNCGKWHRSGALTQFVVTFRRQ